MPFKGVLKQGSGYMIEINSQSTDAIGVTILKINKRDKIASADPSTVAAGATTQTNDTLGSGIDRLLITISPPVGGRATVRVVQGVASYLDDITGDTQFVYD